MANLFGSWDRIVLVALVATLGLSTGVASILPQGIPPVTGHTAFVTGVHYVDLPEAPAPPRLEYGLATYRDIRFFGLWQLEKPVPVEQNRMVFVWSSAAADPRQDPTLAPTLEYAKVRDRLGVEWTVYEFTYQDGPLARYAYGVRVGPVYDAADPSIGVHGRYNHVLVYRPDRLLAPPTPAPAAGPPAADAVDPELGLVPQDVFHAAAEDPAPAPADTPTTPRLAFGLGRTPATLDANDPAPRRAAAPSPPGIPDLDDL